MNVIYHIRHCLFYVCAGAPLSNALLWVSDTPPRVDDYTSRYDGFTAADFSAQNFPGDTPRPVLHICTNSAAYVKQV